MTIILDKYSTNTDSFTSQEVLLDSIKLDSSYLFQVFSEADSLDTPWAFAGHIEPRTIEGEPKF